MTKHLCQGPECHTYKTQSRVRGPKGAKVLRTRNAYGDSDRFRINSWCLYFCDERCMQDWLREHIANFMNIIGIKTRPSETPVDVIKETYERESYTGSKYTYTDTTIKLLSEVSEIDSIAT
jgi:hypothetical protein